MAGVAGVVVVDGGGQMVMKMAVTLTKWKINPE